MDRRAQRIGAIASAVLLCAVVAILFVDAGDLVPSVRIEVLFSHPGALEPGAQVQLGPKVVGEVEGLEHLPRERLEPGHPLAETGGVSARLRLDAGAAEHAFVNSEYFLAPKGLLGAPTLHIGPPPAVEALGRRVRDGDVVRGSDPARIDLLIVLGFQTTETAKEVFRSLAPDLEALQEASRRLSATLRAAQLEPGDLERLDAASARFSAELDRLDQLAGEVSLSDLVAVARRAEALADAAGAQLGALGEKLEGLQAELSRRAAQVPDDLGPRLGRVITQLRAVDHRVRAIRRHARELAALVDGGRGSIGAIMNDPEFADQAKELGKIIKRQPWRIIARPLF